MNLVKSLGERLLLEVGAGTGLTSIMLSLAGHDVVSLDSDREICAMMKENAEKFAAEIHVLCADACFLPIRDKCIGATFSQGVLEHFDTCNLILGLTEQRRVANHVCFEVPSEKWVRAPTSTETFGDEHFRSLNGWTRAIEAAKLSVKRRYGWGFQARYRRLKRWLPEAVWLRIQARCADVLGFLCE